MIANTLNSRYDHLHLREAREMIDDAQVAALKRRIMAGETSDDLWLPVTLVGRILGVTRGTVHNRIRDKRIRTRPKAGGPQRLCDPADVRALLVGEPLPDPRPEQSAS